jgi:hypothetical protein
MVVSKYILLSVLLLTNVKVGDKEANFKSKGEKTRSATPRELLLHSFIGVTSFFFHFHGSPSFFSSGVDPEY